MGCLLPFFFPLVFFYNCMNIYLLTRVLRINSYLLKHHLPPVTILTSKEDLDNFKAIDDHVFIAYLDSPSSSAKQDVLLQETFTSIAHAHHHRFVFGLVLDRQLAEEELLPVNLNLPCVVSYKIAEDDNEALALAATTPGSQEGDSFTKETLEEFVETTAQSAIGEMTRRNMDDYFAVFTSYQYI